MEIIESAGRAPSLKLYLMEIIAGLLSRAVLESDGTRRTVWTQTILKERIWNVNVTHSGNRPLVVLKISTVVSLKPVRHAHTRNCVNTATAVQMPQVGAEYVRRACPGNCGDWWPNSLILSECINQSCDIRSLIIGWLVRWLAISEI